MPEKKTSFSFVPLAAAAVVLTGAAAGAYLYFKGSFTNLGPLDSAKVVPDEALVAAYINTDPGTWSKLQQFGTAEAQRAIASGLENFKTNLRDEQGLDYDQDLKPWVDGVMLAVLPSATEAGTSEPEPSVLMVVGIKDKIAALNFARKMESRDDVPTEEISYKGVKMTKIGGEESDPIYTAVLDDYVAIAFNQGMLENAIDTVKGEPSLASKPEAAKLISSSSGKVQNPIAGIYMPDYAGAMQQFLELVPEASELPEEIKYVKNGALVVGVDDAGLRLKASAEVDPAGFPNFGQAQNKFTSRFPADTLALIGGRGLARAWSGLVAGAPSQPELQELVDELRSSLKEEADLDVDREVFGWMDGEFAAGVFLPPLGGQGFPAGAMIFETSDRSTAETTLQKLQAYFQKNLPVNLEIAQNNIQGVDVTEWKIPMQNEAIGGYGWLDGNSVFLVVGGPFLDAIAIPASDPLDSSPNYKAIAGSLPQSNYSYFYLDMEKVMVLAGPALLAGGAQFPPETQAILYSIQGIGVAATAPNSSTTEMEMLLALKKRDS